MTRVTRMVTHGATHYAQREYGERNGQVSYLAQRGDWYGWGLTPRAAALDPTATQHPAPADREGNI